MLGQQKIEWVPAGARTAHFERLNSLRVEALKGQVDENWWNLEDSFGLCCETPDESDKMILRSSAFRLVASDSSALGGRLHNYLDSSSS